MEPNGYSVVELVVVVVVVVVEGDWLDSVVVVVVVVEGDRVVVVEGN